MGLRYDVYPAQRPQDVIATSVIDNIFCYTFDKEARHLLGARAVSLCEGVHVHLVTDYEEGLDRQPYEVVARQFNRKNQIEHILPWLSKTLGPEILPTDNKLVTIQHLVTPEDIPFFTVRQFPNMYPYED